MACDFDTIHLHDEKLRSLRETVFFNEASIHGRFGIEIEGFNFGFADSVSRPVYGALRYRPAIFQRKKLAWRLDSGSAREHRVKEVEHLRAQDGKSAAYKDEHLAGRDDLLGVAVSLLLRRSET
jgi:hypothetical protein